MTTAKVITGIIVGVLTLTLGIATALKKGDTQQTPVAGPNVTITNSVGKEISQQVDSLRQSAETLNNRIAEERDHMMFNAGFLKGVMWMYLSTNRQEITEAFSEMNVAYSNVVSALK